MSAPVLSVRKLTKTFGGVQAVDDISLEIFAREKVALIGPNGAGKTTFYNMLSGRMQPSSGNVLFEGRDVTGLPPHRISRLGISRSFQITNIFPELTARQNVEVALTALHRKGLHMFRLVSRDQALHDEAQQVLECLGLGGLGGLGGMRTGVLSYGDKRLLEMAIVLATQPRLVLLDELTAGMTPELAQGTWEEIHDNREVREAYLGMEQGD